MWYHSLNRWHWDGHTNTWRVMRRLRAGVPTHSVHTPTRNQCDVYNSMVYRSVSKRKVTHVLHDFKSSPPIFRTSLSICLRKYDWWNLNTSYNDTSSNDGEQIDGVDQLITVRAQRWNTETFDISFVIGYTEKPWECFVGRYGTEGSSPKGWYVDQQSSTYHRNLNPEWAHRRRTLCGISRFFKSTERLLSM